MLRQRWEFQQPWQQTSFSDSLLTEFPFNSSNIRSFSDYAIIKIQSLYSEKPEPDINDKICICEFTVDLKTNSVKSFNVYDYVDKWDNSMLFIENDEAIYIDCYGVK